MATVIKNTLMLNSSLPVATADRRLILML